MSEPTHQLVIQLPESAFLKVADVIRYEDALVNVLADAHEVDGHDIGAGEVNSFVLTADPSAALSMIRDIGSLLAHPEVRVALRPMTGVHYTLLWPVGDQRDFAIA